MQRPGGETGDAIADAPVPVRFGRRLGLPTLQQLEQGDQWIPNGAPYSTRSSSLSIAAPRPMKVRRPALR